METAKKTQLTLEQVLVSYNVMILFFILFIILMIILTTTNKKGFNKSFGYEIFITVPILLFISFLIKEIFAFKNNPQDSWFSMLSQSTENWFIPVVSLFIILLGILGLFMMLYVGGIFSDSPPENNTAMILNFIIISLFIIIAGVIYKKYKTADEHILNTLPRPIQEVFHLRTKYTAIFALFIFIITIIYFVNPCGIMTSYGGPAIFFSLFVGIIMVIMITIYQTYLANPSKTNILNDTPGPLTFIMKSLYFLGSLGISFGLIFCALNVMGVFEQDASKPETWGHTLFNFILFSAMLGIIYKLINAGGFLDKNPYYRLIINTILYIPCLLVSTTNYFSQLFTSNKTSNNAFAPSKSYEIKMLLLSLGLLVGYFLWIFKGKKYIQSAYLKQGGKQLINQPVPTDILTNVTSYQSLSGSDKFDYQYAMSFWLYLDAFPPSTNASYNKIVPILSYGENPAIKYSSSNNTLYITVKQNDDINSSLNSNSIINYFQEKENNLEDTIKQWNDNNVQDKINNAIEKVKSMPFGNETDANGHRIIYKHSDVQLQKWNHILLNYSGGTLDVFYNGKLVKSAIEVVPYMNFDMLTTGTDEGISGNIANLMYFKQPLDVLTVNTLYNSLKNQNPPVIMTNNDILISL